MSNRGILSQLVTVWLGVAGLLAVVSMRPPRDSVAVGPRRIATVVVSALGWPFRALDTIADKAMSLVFIDRSARF